MTLGYVIGTIVDRDGSLATVCTDSGLGPEMHAPQGAPAELGKQVEWFVHEQQGERGSTLFAFVAGEQRAFFRRLIKIRDVGPTKAHVVCAMPRRAFAEAVLGRRIDILASLPGLGKKTAENIINGFDEKLARAWAPGFHAETAEEAVAKVRAVRVQKHPHEADIVSGLRGLGYDPKKVAAFAATLPPSMGVEEAMTNGIRELAAPAKTLPPS